MITGNSSGNAIETEAVSIPCGYDDCNVHTDCRKQEADNNALHTSIGIHIGPKVVRFGVDKP